MAQHEILFANYHCRFGEEKRLLDYAVEIVIPAYTDNSLFRKYADTTFFFHETSVVNVGNEADPIIAICGRFIKDTNLKREQIFSRGYGLIKDRRTMQSSPSAIFVLILNNHRIIYYPETAYAPDLKSFEATSIHLLKQTHQNFIDSLYGEKKSWGEKVTKWGLIKAHPKPTLDVVPLSSKDSLSDFIRRYDKLKRISIRLVNPNDEIDVDELFEALRKQKERIGAKDTSLIHTNISEGLDKEQSIQDLSSLTSIGLYRLNFSGQDLYGDKLVGNNHDFQLKAPTTELQGDIPTKAAMLYDIFDTLVRQETIEVPPKPPITPLKIRKLMPMVKDHD